VWCLSAAIALPPPPPPLPPSHASKIVTPPEIVIERHEQQTLHRESPVLNYSIVNETRNPRLEVYQRSGWVDIPYEWSYSCLHTATSELNRLHEEFSQSFANSTYNNQHTTSTPIKQPQADVNVFINEQSNEVDVQEWLQAKGFSIR
jgi:hypothetical protein